MWAETGLRQPTRKTKGAPLRRNVVAFEDCMYNVHEDRVLQVVSVCVRSSAMVEALAVSRTKSDGPVEERGGRDTWTMLRLLTQIRQVCSLFCLIYYCEGMKIILSH